MAFLKPSDWRFVLATSVACATMLVACGGGGDTTSAASTATANNAANNTAAAAAVSDTYSQGPISGFGSIVVGGVRYEDSGATVTDEDGVSHNRSALKLGMTVQVDAGVVTRLSSSSSASAVASRIRFGSEIVGPVGTIDTAAGTLQVLGQPVVVTSATVFDTTLVGGLSALATGAVVEVHGIRDTATGHTVATRIEAKSAATSYRLRGTVAALDSTAKTFKLGTETINYASVATVPADLADGQMVRVLLQTAQVAGAWVATALHNGTRLPVGTVREAHMEGLITAYTSSTAFTVNGLLVDASSATFPDGTTGIVLGARVEVTGSVTNGKLVATNVEIEERRDAGRRGMELHGDITAIDTTAKTFVLRGVTVWYGGTVTYKNGAETGLAVGQAVEVHGVRAADGTRFEARSIELKGTTSTSTTG